MEAPRILEITEKKLVGMRTKITLANDQTRQLWKQFMSRRHEIKYRKGTELYNLQLYDQPLNMNEFTPHTVFEKWAAVEVERIDDIPAGMESYRLSGGKYAVFLHKGPAAGFRQTLQHIFGYWLPNSAYKLDHRAHFEILGEKYYGPDDPRSEEEVWIPVR